MFDLPAAVGVVGGTVSLIGGHGTTIAWAPSIASDFGLTNAMEIGIASATFGLILASVMGDPIAKFLINRHSLLPLPPAQEQVQNVGLSEANKQSGIGHMDFLGAVLAIHLSIIVGYFLNTTIGGLGLKLPSSSSVCSPASSSPTCCPSGCSAGPASIDQAAAPQWR